ncbi:MAG TPA: hypothetical protein VGT99_01690 [Gammaproteobacteria bacterium]|nr:hypothetical protein [Gammaproteobacteria bacterium]
MRYSFSSQIHNNIVALISLGIAVSGFSYAMWRDEQSEKNRNIRTASFEVLMEVEQLRLIVDYAHYDKDKQRGNPITGWPHVFLIRDLSHLINPDTASAGDKLFATWSDNWDSIDTSQESVDKITSAIEEVRGQDLKVLRTIK